ncbi:MAG: heavy metal translocating P-type ATPase, partial [Candidatus Micrarchaeia archaeon]
IGELIEFAPTTARVKRDGKEFEVDANHVKKDDVVIVKTGEKIPVDGEVVKGNASVNQSSITGESVCMEKNVGDKVFAGTINESGALQVKATKLYSESTFVKIISLVEEAESSKAPVQRLADKFTQYFAPLVLIAAVLTFAFTQNPLYAIAVVVVACPCAVALATPLAVVASTGKAAKRGIITKGGASLETLSKVDTIVMDKTGTLTFGKPRVVETKAFAECTEKEIIRLAAGAEKLSEHPLAKSILAKAAEYDFKIEEPDKFEVVKGKGIIAHYKKSTIIVGNRELLKTNEIIISSEVEEFTATQEKKGRTVLLLAHDTDVCGAICVADDLRNNAAQAIKELKKAGIKKIVMLTGDNKRTAQAVATQLEVDEAVAEMLPEEKVEKVRQTMKKGAKVAMVGDGVNDAPALAAADVGIAMGTAGSDVAIETADIALMKDDLTAIVDAVKIGRHTFSTIKQNIALAVVFNIVGVGLASTGFLTPILAAIAHSLPDVLVFLNSSKLYK